MNERMLRAMDPCRFVLIALAGWMNQLNYRLLTIFAKRIVYSASNPADADCASTTINADD
jgi:hypothetical protein